ncbi:hypothetical protein PVAND_005213 [Polypedilum vanderplanki]|uniref:HAT C-terminal dimerisation domain-containing protein n=1 Tax=Polypedilum vanderplanki TaxID=319348 RepID=A0A9J6C0D3_POLVA|nr:hypothetical protein PVAND_005213 [Polypedilum vanderplanki]
MEEEREKSTNARVKEYFIDSPNNPKKKRCTLCQEERDIAGSVTHLKDHIISIHKDIADGLGLKANQKRKKNNRPSSSVSDNNSSGLDEMLEAEIITPETIKKVRLTINLNDFLKEYIQMILSKNLSFSSADSIGKMTHVHDILSAFNTTFNRHKLKDYVLSSYKQIINIITKEVEGFLLSIMIDSCSRHNRNVFSISIRYLKDGKITERTIGMFTQTGRQTGAALSEQIKDALIAIGKTIDDVYCSCSDGGRNMQKASDLIFEGQQVIRNLCGLIYENTEDIETFLSTLDLLEENEDELITSNNTFEFEIDEHSDQHLYESSIGSKFPCGAHKLQLAANSVNSIADVNKILTEIRKIAIESKKLAYRHLFENVSMPKSDVSTRWDSSFIMIKSFKDNQDIYQNFDVNKLKLTAEQWTFVNDYYDLFSPIHEAMLYFQKKDVTISDCYIQWLLMEIRISKMKDDKFNMRSYLLRAIKDKSQSFFESKAFAACLILDPRINWRSGNEIFSNDLLEKGINHLVRIYHKMTETYNLPQNNQQEQIATVETEDQALLRQYLLGDSETFRDTSVDTFTNIRMRILEFVHNEPRVSMIQNFNVLKYWQTKRHQSSSRSLYDLSQVIFGAPFTQTKVEREFSTFGLVYTHLRTVLSAELLNAIHVVKSNLDLFPKVKLL